MFTLLSNSFLEDEADDDVLAFVAFVAVVTDIQYI
jgi:hypothetical protein